MAKKTETVIETVELTKVYKDFWGRGRVKALDSLSLTVSKGEVLGLLGPNGSGKTTTVRLLLGLLFPTRGLVYMFGRGPRDVDTKKLVGYMPEESNLYSYLNAEETLNFFGRLFGLSGAERTKRVDSLIEMVGLQRARRRPIGEFSKGMARRIGLAQALINDPDLLILDEPTTGLDPIGSKEMKDLIGMLRKRGKTILVCSHLLADVEETCDRVCILYGGKVRAMGEVKDLLLKQEMTQIRSPKVPEPVLEHIAELIHSSLGSDALIEVGSPTQKLEEFFLEVVATARRERLATSGAEAGGRAAEFLAPKDEAGEALVDKLVAASQRAEAPAEKAPQAQPAGPEPSSAPDEGLLAELAASRDEAAKAEEKQEEPKPVAPDTSVRHDLLDDLLDEVKEGGQKEGRGNGEEAG